MILITEKTTDISIAITLKLALNTGVLPADLPAALGGATARTNFQTDLVTNMTNYQNKLEARIANRIQQLGKGQNLVYSALAQWIDEEKGPCYNRTQLSVSAASADKRTQTATQNAHFIHIRSVETPKVTLKLEF